MTRAQKEPFDENEITSKMTEEGYFRRVKVRDSKGRTKTITERVKENPQKVRIEKILFNGFYLEVFYYKENPSVIYIGTGDKIAVMQDYEIKRMLSLALKVGNRTKLFGGDCNKIVRERFKELMKEKLEKEEKGEENKE